MALPIVVVGGGIGGLSAAIELGRRGEKVILFEGRSELGGKARSMVVGGLEIDVGPTVLTMPWVFDELLGRPLDSVVQLDRIERIARHSFADGSVLDLFTDIGRSAAAIEAFAGAREADAYRHFARYSRTIAETVEEPFLRAQRPTFTSLLLGATSLGLSALTRIDAHRTMWSALRSIFRDQRLIALFARYATYVGSSPLEAPATFNLIAHVERSGVVAVEGGISQLARALADHARSLGVEIELGTRVTDIVASRGTVESVELLRADGTRDSQPVRGVVLNADVASIAGKCFGATAARAVAAPAPSRRSLSAMTWAIAGSAEGFELAHHNVFFGSDYERETRTLWKERALPDDPTVYLGTPDRKRFFLIANAPALVGDHECSETEMDRCERSVFSRLEKAGLILRKEAFTRMSPHDFAKLAPGTGGAIYGEAAHGSLASLTRPGARTKLRGLYLAGGSVHPGPGVPMAALSGRLAAQAALGDLASTRPSLREATAGSTSIS